MFSKKLAITLFATVATVSAGSAFAGERVKTTSIPIDIAGYDLTTDKGSDVIVMKIENAAKKACDARSGPMPLSEQRRVQACVDAAVSDALESLAVERQRQAAVKAGNAG